MSKKPFTRMCERADRILKEISGVVSQYDITQWEIAFLNDMQGRGIIFGTFKQEEVMDRIEEKVFG